MHFGTESHSTLGILINLPVIPVTSTSEQRNQLTQYLNVVAVVCKVPTRGTTRSRYRTSPRSEIGPNNLKFPYSNTKSSIDIQAHVIALVLDLKSGQITLNSLISERGLPIDWVHSIELDGPGPFERKLSDPLLQRNGDCR
ncbi:hypothetical protein QE152_g19810 [Popillia japonica]|uniref:Uncharacterized protein n=1 Tax=Popillia japonica TaxID=7064 RepID=A0AAW1KRB2_POPJA